MGERLRAVPAWAWLAAIVLCSFVARSLLSRHMLAPFIMTDELTYSELGRSLAAARSLEIRDVPISGYGVLYPLLIAPAYALFDSLTDAYAAVKVINSLTMSLAAIPTYLIARRVAGTGLALLAALLAVSLPSLVYTATVMTENLYYPLALVVMWMTLVVLSRPTWRNTVLLCVALGFALATRTQAVALGAGIVFAPLVLAVLEGSRLVRVRAAWRLYALLGGAAALVLAAQLARGHSVSGLLGAYGVVGDRSYDLATVLRYWLWHAEELTLYLGVVPVAATLVLLGRARRLPARLQEHLAVTVSFSVWTTLSWLPLSRPSSQVGSRSATRSRSPLSSSSPSSPGSRSGRRVRGRSAAVATAARRRARRRVPVHALHRRAGQVGHARDSFPIWSAFGHMVLGLDLVQRARSERSLWRRSSCSSLLGGPCSSRWPSCCGSGSSGNRCGRGHTASCRRARARSSRGSGALRATGSTPRSRQERPRASCGRASTDRFTVNQNEFFNRSGRAGLLRRGADAGKPAGDRDHRRPGGRCPATSRRVAAHRPLPRHRCLARARRARSRAGCPARD